MTPADLIKKVEGLDGPDREVDADIYEMLGYRVKRQSERKPGYTYRTTRAFAYLDGNRWIAMERLTASVDAVGALIERVLPGWQWDVGHRLRAPKAPPLYHAGLFGERGLFTSYDRPSPALALLVCLLRSLEARDKGDG